MSDETMVSEKDAVLRERKAWVSGWRFGAVPLSNASAQAAKHYPLPKVTRPREVTDGVWQFRVINGRLELRAVEGGHWGEFDADDMVQRRQYSVAVTPSRVALWAELFATPNEDVEDES